MAKKKVKIYWGRIFIALAILITILMLFIWAIKSVIGAFIGDDSSEVKANASSSSSEAVETTTGASDTSLTVCIDAGHGGEEDSGAPNADETRLERDDNLSLALLVRDALEEQGVTVVMTRDTDVFIELYDRPKIANDADADLFVSLHRNSYTEGQGIEAWVNWNAPKADTVLADCILSSFDESMITENRGVCFGYTGLSTSAHTNYAVNEHTKMPSCLLEVGFITNDEDNTLFDKYIKSYAESIANGIIEAAEKIGIIEDPTGEVTAIDLDSYSYEGAPDTVDVTYDTDYPYEAGTVDTTSETEATTEEATKKDDDD